jgi:hypothetical protein
VSRKFGWLERFNTTGDNLGDFGGEGVEFYKVVFIDLIQVLGSIQHGTHFAKLVIK